jgi:hypothetical protein
MDRETNKHKKYTEEKEEDEPWPESYTEPSGPTYRTPPYDSEDSTNNFGASTVHTYYATDNWKSVDEPSGTGRYWYTRALRNIRKSFNKHSTRYKQGWSPSLLGSTEAFFENFQATYIKWSELWPNTRIPLTETTPESQLKNCRIIQAVVEDKKQKPKFHEVNLQRRHGEEIIDFRDLSNPDYFPVLATKEPVSTRFIRNHDRNSYTGFYHMLQLTEERFTSEEEVEEKSERLVQSYAIYTNSKGRRLKDISENQDKLSTNYVPWTTWKPNSGANYTIKILPIIHLLIILLVRLASQR